LLSFCHFPAQIDLGIVNYDSSGSGSYGGSSEISFEPRRIGLDDGSYSLRSLEEVSPRAIEDDDGWVRWRWSQSTVGASGSPNSDTVIY
jgi:hypothetical protein